MVFLMLLGSNLLRGIWKSSIVLWGLLFGSICYYLLAGNAAPQLNSQVTGTELSFFLPQLSFDPAYSLSYFVLSLYLSMS
jgi:hypothetical protein